jgi:hypothetical protein
MNNLPQVLQNEIWDYVRGDRAYWKQLHSAIVNEWFPAFRHKSPRLMSKTLRVMQTAGKGTELKVQITWFTRIRFIASRDKFFVSIRPHSEMCTYSTGFTSFTAAKKAFLSACRDVAASVY